MFKESVKSLFKLDHTDRNYVAHLFESLRFTVVFVILAFMSLVHAFLPAVFVHSTSRVLRLAYISMESRRKDNNISETE